MGKPIRIRISPTGKVILTVTGVLFIAMALVTLVLVLIKWFNVLCNACDFRAWIFGMVVLALLGILSVIAGQWQDSGPDSTPESSG